ncbi:MAG TPA: NAD(P)/FAD-dependent oxidoreductase [Candidatus Limnocylindrales bacterium]|nr:NAD(P)/FAD-dependent oxidoreductase [Candidatus Limnocylindrales bacterium]
MVVGSVSSYDAIVIGGGHNGLVTAAYLGKAGLRTVVLERQGRLGGAVGTTELAPGAHVPTLAHTVGRLRPSVVRDLELKRHGLSLIGPDVRVFAPGPDGDAVVLWGDAARTADGLRSRSAADAEHYGAFDRLVRSLAGFLGELAGRTPPDIGSPGLGDALTGLQLGRTFRGLGRDDGRTMTRVLPMAIADFVAESFVSDAVQAAIAWRGIQYTAMGPWSAGTTAVLLGDSAGNDGGAAGQTVFVRGGPGALITALQTAALANGVTIRSDAEVVSITSRDGRATGVVLADGETLDARAVIAAIDPKRLLTTLVDPVAVGPNLLWRAGNIRTPGTVAKVNLVLAGPPVFPAAGDDPRLLRGRILIAPGIDAMERAHDAAKYGRYPDAPIMEATIPSLADPSLVESAAPGTHVMSVIVQSTPYTLRDGSWDDAREAFGDLVVKSLDGYAPGLANLVTARQVITPLDLARDVGLTGGHPMHGEHGLDQFFLWRPLLGHARYRIALDGLYLAGAGSHPGGGVTGQNGQNAAREIVSDLRRRRR